MDSGQFLEDLGFKLTKQEFPLGVSGAMVGRTIWMAIDPLGRFPPCSSQIAYHMRPVFVDPAAKRSFEAAEDRHAWKLIAREIVKEMMK